MTYNFEQISEILVDLADKIWFRECNIFVFFWFDWLDNNNFKQTIICIIEHLNNWICSHTKDQQPATSDMVWCD